MENNTNHPISSNNHLSVTANKAIHCLNWEGLYNNITDIILFWQDMNRCTLGVRKIISHHANTSNKDQSILWLFWYNASKWRKWRNIRRHSRNCQTCVSDGLAKYIYIYFLRYKLKINEVFVVFTYWNVLSQNFKNYHKPPFCLAQLIYCIEVIKVIQKWKNAAVALIYITSYKSSSNCTL